MPSSAWADTPAVVWVSEPVNPGEAVTVYGGPWAKVGGEDRWYAALGTIDSALNWPLQRGRGPWIWPRPYG